MNIMNDFFKLFSFQGGMIVQHTSLITLRKSAHKFGFILDFLYSTHNQNDTYRLKYLHTRLIIFG